MHISADDAARTAFVGARGIVRLLQEKDPLRRPPSHLGHAGESSFADLPGIAAVGHTDDEGDHWSPLGTDGISHSPMAA